MIRAGLTTTMIQGGKSGVGQYVFALVRELLKTGRVDLTLFVLERDVPLFAFTDGRCRLVTVPESERPPVKNILWHQLQLPREAGKLKLEVLHAPSYRRLVLSAPCARVGTIHDLAPFHVRKKYDAARMFYGRVVVRRLARSQNGLIAISHSTARDIERFFGIPQNRQRIIHNGIDHTRFHPGQPDADHAWAAETLGLSQPFFLYISRLEHPAKNHVRLIDAFTRFKQDTGLPWQLALGGSDWHGAEIIRAAAASSPFTRDIIFTGFVSDETLPRLYRAAQVMVYPSLFEGFGLPPVEAMACGTPVISSTRGALEEVVADAALTIDPENPMEMAAALTKLATDRAAADRLRTAGLANAARFDWARTAAGVTEAYASAIQGKGSVVS
ncbi:MAG: glycosyltransferase family 1 protein [Verrucomicrobiaceae bacterium]|nr:MAG: glycosyltransferase family 1 protein [Verrucomicrobiaceae bacterium]